MQRQFFLMQYFPSAQLKGYHYTHEEIKSASYHTMLHMYSFNEFTSFIMRNKTFHRSENLNQYNSLWKH